MNCVKSLPLVLVVVLLPFTMVLSFQQEVPRRDALLQAMAAASLLLVPSAPANAVLRSKGCYQGEGEGCAELADENALIKSLQEKSALNREKNEKV